MDGGAELECIRATEEVDAGQEINLFWLEDTRASQEFPRVEGVSCGKYERKIFRDTGYEGTRGNVFARYTLL
jgi:hypothetical protein